MNSRNLELARMADETILSSIQRKIDKKEKLLPDEIDFLSKRKEIFIPNSIVVVRSTSLLKQKCKSVNISFGYQGFFKKPFTKDQWSFLDSHKIHTYLIVREVGQFDVVVRSLMSPEGDCDMDFTISKIDLEQIM